MNKKAMIACIVASSVVLTACGNGAKKVTSYLESYKFEKAYDYYMDKVRDSKNADEANKDIEDTLSSIYDGIVEKYSLGEITESDIEYLEKLAKKANFDDSSDYSDFLSDIYTVDSSISYYESAMEAYDDGDYTTAYNYFSYVDEAYAAHYDDAVAKMNECKELASSEEKENIEKLIANGDYEEALTAINSLASTDKETANTLYTELETEVSTFLDGEIDKYFKSFDYEGAYDYLSDIYYSYSYDFIQEKMNNLENDFVNYSLDVAESDASENNYEAAQSVVLQAMEAVGEDNEILVNAYEEYRSHLPVYINDLDYMSCVNEVYSTDNLKDNTGVLYHKGLAMCKYFTGDGGEGSAEYYINGKYATFTGTVAVRSGNEDNDDSAYFEIYGDGKLLYTSPVMTKSSFPESFNINVTGVKMLKISYPASNSDEGMATLYDGVLTPPEQNSSSTDATTAADGSTEASKAE